MDQHDPTQWNIYTWLLGLGMASAGGLVNWLFRLRHGRTRPFNIIELMGEIFTSGFVGIGVFMVIFSMDQSIGLSAAAAGIGGHMATRLLFLVEKTLEHKIADINQD